MNPSQMMMFHLEKDDLVRAMKVCENQPRYSHAEIGQAIIKAHGMGQDQLAHVVSGNNTFVDLSHIINDLVQAGFRLLDVEMSDSGIMYFRFVLDDGKSLELTDDVFDFLNELTLSTWEHIHVWDSEYMDNSRVNCSCGSRTTEPARCQLRLQNGEWTLVSF